MAITKEYRRSRIKKRIRKVVTGTPDSPRLSVFRSNTQIYVQLIDDSIGKTLLAASSKQAEIASQKVNKIENNRFKSFFTAVKNVNQQQKRK